MTFSSAAAAMAAYTSRNHAAKRDSSRLVCWNRTNRAQAITTSAIRTRMKAATPTRNTASEPTMLLTVFAASSGSTGRCRTTKLANRANTMMITYAMPAMAAALRCDAPARRLDISTSKVGLTFRCKLTLRRPALNAFVRATDDQEVCRTTHRCRCDRPLDRCQCASRCPCAGRWSGGGKQQVGRAGRRDLRDELDGLRSRHGRQLLPVAQPQRDLAERSLPRTDHRDVRDPPVGRVPDPVPDGPVMVHLRPQPGPDRVPGEGFGRVGLR